MLQEVQKTIWKMLVGLGTPKMLQEVQKTIWKMLVGLGTPKMLQEVIENIEDKLELLEG